MYRVQSALVRPKSNTTMQSMNPNTLNNRELPFSAAAFTTFLCTIFGANAVAIKISLFGVGAFTTAGIRFSLAAIAIFLWAWATRRPFVINKRQSRQLLILSLMFVVQLSLLYLGISKTTASRGVLMMYRRRSIGTTPRGQRRRSRTSPSLMRVEVRLISMSLP